MWLLIFLLNATLDIIWARYTMAVQARQPAISGVWAALIIIVGGISVLSYVNDPILLIPASVGAFMGTWIAVGRAVYEGR